ncbi:MAG TPA: alpha-L-fucosidase [Gemmatimonadales bacterium]|nr:alpha-L-fucosidase [Gemmatimonadales bacterium]
MHSNRRTFLKSSALAAGAFAIPIRRPGDLWATILPPQPADSMTWWREARFGMFIHWGLYSILAGSWGGRDDYAEWIRNNAHIPIGEYDKLVGRFDPTRFDPDAWATMARDAGMKYVTITTKHHDGFGLFDSKLTDFCIRSTPWKRDVMRDLSTAVRRQGLVQCWYHSIMDWHHPDYLPRRDWEAATRPVGNASFERYRQYLHGQVAELLRNYGEIGVMWFDGNWEGTWTHEMGQALYDHCKKLQPNVIVNNRVEGWSPVKVAHEIGDFRTPEQEVPATGWPGVDWESCITMNGNWGYNAKDKNFKSTAQLIGLLTETASKGGNLLLNIGPRPDGTFPDESVQRLAELGKWMSVNGGAIHGSTASPFANAPCRVTSQLGKLNLFITDWSDSVTIPLTDKPVQRAYLLADHSPLVAQKVPDGVRISLPPQKPDPICSVVVCEVGA